MKNNRKLGSSVLALSLISTMALGGSLAYLTANDSETNEFTYAKEMSVDVVEPNWDPEDATEVRPNEEIAKDPAINNDGDEEIITFVKLTVPVKTVTNVSDDGTQDPNGAQAHEIFFMKQAEDGAGTHANNFSPEWIHLDTMDEGTDLSGATRTYVFGYATKVAPGETTENLFDKVQVRNIVENEIAAEAALDIVIDGYAIQSNDVLSGDEDLAANLSKENLTAIYQIYVKQQATAPTAP